MKQIALRGRRLLRKVLTALSLGAVAITFQACYGPPPYNVSLNGTVKSDDAQEPIPGICVSVTVNYNHDEYDLTDRDGRYRLFVRDQEYTVLFEDIDGAENGEFHNKEVTWNPDDGPLNVFLERKE
ncbi:MAG: radical SAM-associated putative lipoprotein [Treponema sp.]|jgi:putative lipoprotein (rSAM/lipoprotein system)|nr:radical SAM-associated putative lipoprotein [Treponema sp.]